MTTTQKSRSYWRKLNLNPDKELVSDCTTRSLAFCLDKTSPKEYKALREKQTEISVAISGKKTDWNAHYVFESILRVNDFIKIIFIRKIPRWKLAEMLKELKVKIFSESYGHVSPIQNGKIYDTWDCTRGMVYSILIPRIESVAVLDLLKANKIEYVMD